MSLSTADKNAASVLPEPVGESRSVEAPEMIAGIPSACARVGAPSAVSNQSRAGSERSRRGSATTRVYALRGGRALQDPVQSRKYVLEQQGLVEKCRDIFGARHVLTVGSAG